MNAQFFAVAGLRTAVFGAIIAFTLSVLISGAVGVNFAKFSNWVMLAVILFSGLFLLLYLVGAVGHAGQGNIGTALALVLMSVFWILNVFSYTIGFSAYRRFFVDIETIESADRYLVDEAQYWITLPIQWLFETSDPLEVINLYELQAFYGTVAAALLTIFIRPKSKE